jgi:hypothetical protein
LCSFASLHPPLPHSLTVILRTQCQHCNTVTNSHMLYVLNCTDGTVCLQSHAVWTELYWWHCVSTVTCCIKWTVLMALCVYSHMLYVLNCTDGTVCPQLTGIFHMMLTYTYTDFRTEWVRKDFKQKGRKEGRKERNLEELWKDKDMDRRGC